MNGAPIRVLLVDDDELQLDLVQRVLASDGFEVQVVHEVSRIADVARTFAPDAVLLDVNVPDAPGGGTVAIARAAAGEKARLFLFSAEDDAKLRSLARALNADGWLSKSVSAFDLGQKIRTALRR